MRHLLDTGIRALRVAHKDHVEKTSGDKSSTTFLFSWLGRAILVHELLRWLRGSLLFALLKLASALGAILLSLWLVPLALRGIRLAYLKRRSSVDSIVRSAAGVVAPRPDGKVHRPPWHACSQICAFAPIQLLNFSSTLPYKASELTSAT